MPGIIILLSLGTFRLLCGDHMNAIKACLVVLLDLDVSGAKYSRIACGDKHGFFDMDHRTRWKDNGMTRLHVWHLGLH